jgi:hypothetical protein
MNQFVPRWAHWPDFTEAGEAARRVPGDLKSSSESACQRTDKTDKSPAGGTAGALPGRFQELTKTRTRVSRCPECRARKAANVAILACGACGFKAERSFLSRSVGRWLDRRELRVAGVGPALRLIDGAGGGG